MKATWREPIPEIASAMLDGILEAVWLDSWASAMEEAGERTPRHITMGTAPPPPASAKKAALAYGKELAFANGSLSNLFTKAARAEGTSALDANQLGYYLAMQGAGHGISWFDDHETFDVYLPSVEWWAQKSGRSWHVEVSIEKRRR